jgi:hypothetical protein
VGNANDLQVHHGLFIVVVKLLLLLLLLVVVMVVVVALWVMQLQWRATQASKAASSRFVKPVLACLLT